MSATKKTWPWLPGFVLLIVLYVLSIGPACRLAQKQTLSWDTVHLIYAPLNLAAKFPPVDRLLQWYIRDVWQVKGQRNNPSRP